MPDNAKTTTRARPPAAQRLAHHGSNQAGPHHDTRCPTATIHQAPALVLQAPSSSPDAPLHTAEGCAASAERQSSAAPAAAPGSVPVPSAPPQPSHRCRNASSVRQPFRRRTPEPIAHPAAPGRRTSDPQTYMPATDCPTPAAPEIQTPAAQQILQHLQIQTPPPPPTSPPSPSLPPPPNPP